MSSKEFVSKTVIITGAGSGIGAATAVKFAEQGANLVLSDVNSESLIHTKNACLEKHLNDEQVILVSGDITNESVQKDIIETANHHFGHIDVLVNNAGINKLTLIHDFDMNDFERVQKVNCWAPVSLSILAIPHLKITKGSIVNVSSGVSTIPLKNGMAYCISKSGVNMLTKSLAFELASEGIRVNAVRPGIVPTNIAKDIPQISDALHGIDLEGNEKMKAIHPMNRLGTADEIANAVLFLASDKASFITGALLPVDGGTDICGISTK